MSRYITRGPDGPKNSVLRLPRGRGRDFVVGDIHGTFTLLAEALTRLRFDPRVDRLICVGDLVDRGAQSRNALAFLKEPWVFCVRGNHEQMHLEAYEPGLATVYGRELCELNGGVWFKRCSVTLQQELLAAFRAMPLVIEVETSHGLVGIIHAEVPIGHDWPSFTRHIEWQDEEACNSVLWGRVRAKYNDQESVPGIARIFAGHTIRPHKPRWYGNTCVVDTGGHEAWTRPDDPREFSLSVINITADAAAISDPTHYPLLSLVEG